MSEKVKITAEFTSPGPNCPCVGTCKDAGMCMEALAFNQEINYRLEGRDDALDYQLKNSVCENPQSLEMYGIGMKLTKKK